MVMLGASVPYLKLSPESIEEGIRIIFGSKGDQVVEMNLNAMKMGWDYAMTSR
jgi:indolepyruvate ferredoxin oxidoreductase beta subunit